MNKSLRITLSLGAVVVMVLVMALLGARSDGRRRETACTDIDVVILDSARLSFVTRNDVKQALRRDYGVFLGQRLDSVRLRQIEEVLLQKSAVRSCEAYVTGDGILHVEVLQREPAVRLEKEDGGCYADRNGFLFPLHPGFVSDVPVVSGALPLSEGPSFRGFPEDPRERRYLEGILALVRSLDGERPWCPAIRKIEVVAGGDLVLYPAEGKERFLLGQPEGFKDKFARMEQYYRIIAPAKEAGYYSVVNLKYDGQIICRQK